MSNWRGKRVLVTGAAGFIGANLLRQLLSADAEVHAIVRPTTNLWRITAILPRLTLHRLDLAQLDPLREAVTAVQPEIIVHLAAPGGHPPSGRGGATMLADHCLATANLLEATMPLEYQRLVHLGSFLEYGPGREPHEECDLLQPSTLRGVAKAAATLLCLQHARAYQRPIVVLRPFSVYGPWEGPDRLIPTAIRALLSGRQDIALTGPGYRRDLVFVADMVEACLLAVDCNPDAGEIINVGSGRESSNEEVVETIQALAGRRLSVRAGAYPPRPADTGHCVADIGKAQRLLGWEPRHSLPAGLRWTIDWFRHHGSLYDTGLP